MSVAYQSIKTRTARQFGGILLSILLIILAYQFLKGYKPDLCLFMCTFLLIIVLLLPAGVIRTFFWGVMIVTGILGTLFTFILLSMIFFLLIFPLGFIRRVMGKSPLHDKKKSDTETYWVSMEHYKNDMTKQF